MLNLKHMNKAMIFTYKTSTKEDINEFKKWIHFDESFSNSFSFLINGKVSAYFNLVNVENVVNITYGLNKEFDNKYIGVLINNALLEIEKNHIDGKYVLIQANDEKHIEELQKIGFIKVIDNSLMLYKNL